MQTPFVIDLETGPRPDAADFLPPLEAPANYRDPEKIAAYLAERRAKQLADAALSAETGRILCAGLLRHGQEPQFIGDDDEGTLLRRFWRDLVTRDATDCFVGFCSHRFDWPFAVRRSYALGVPVPDWFPKDGRYPRHAFTDLAELWQAGDRTESISLDRLARLCGLPGKTGNGADFARLWREDPPAALAYLRQDLELTRDLWARMAGP